MADLNKLAILINQNEDLYSLADNLGIDAGIIETALTSGEGALSRNDRLELEETMSRYERTQLDDYAQAELEDLTETLSELIDKTDDFRNANDLREFVATDQITLSDLNDLDLLFGQGGATMYIQNTIIDWLKDGGNASSFLDLFANDGYRIDDITDSEFWAWYRETFYND
jgi:hypothetical protein